ncbi:MAG: SGNH/GDSL hydrolase family protein [Nevskiales bacterium]
MNTERSNSGLVLGWWLALILLGPLLWAQGRWARWRTPRLPALATPLAGTTGEGETTLHLLVLGESPAAGVGVASREESLPARLAAELARRQGIRVAWSSVAENGANLRCVIDTQLPQLASTTPDLVLVVLGVNDTTGLTQRSHWRSQLAELIAGLRARSDCPILFTSVPRMDSFTALPQPLRSALGLRGRLLDKDLHQVAAVHEGVSHASALPRLGPQQLAADGYHPSAIACLDWAVQLADCLPPLPDRARPC